MMPEVADLMLVGPQELREGECYGMLLFLDEGLRFPEIQIWVYVGKDIEGRCEEKWYFQDIESYSKHGGVLKGHGTRKLTLFVADENEVTHMFDLVGLGQALIRLGSTRQSAP